MAENTFRNTRSPRYSTTRATGFAGGSIDSAGNLAPATATARRGSSDSAFSPPPTTPSQPKQQSTPAIANFSASVPKPQSKGQAFVQGIGNQVASNLIKTGLNKGFDAATKTVRNATAGPDYGGDPLPSAKDFPVSSADYSGANAQQFATETATEAIPDGISSEVAGNVGDISSGGGDVGFAAPEGVASDVFGGASEAAGASVVDGVGSEVAGNVADIALAEAGGEAAGIAAGEAVGEGAGAAAGASWIPGWGWVIGAARLVKGLVADSEPGSVGGVIDTLLLPSHEQWLADPGNSAISSLDPIGQATRDVLGIDTPDCFITEAVMSQQGMHDNSQPLEVLRSFRDNIMMQSPEGQAMVQEYEQIAPQVVEAIGQHENAMQIFQQIYSEFIVPAVEAVKAGDYKGALEIYAKMVSFAASFSEEVMQGDDEAMAGISELGDHAAMVGQDDDTTAMIGGQGVGDADWSQNSQFMPATNAGPQQPAQMPAIAQMGIPPRRY